MIYELFVVGGMIFWALIAVTLILSYASLENEDGYAILLPIICFLAIFGLSNAEIETVSNISLSYVAGYFAAGAATWFFIFNTKLVKIKRFLKENSISSSKELYEISNCYDGAHPKYHLRRQASQIYEIYNSETAIDNFF